MTQQLALLSPGTAGKEIAVRLLCRRDDPHTSVEGARSVIRRALKSQCAEVLALVKAWPGSTAAELHRNSGKPGEWRFIISKRLPILERRGLISCGRGVDGKPASVKTCLVTKHLAATWWPVEE